MQPLTPGQVQHVCPPNNLRSPTSMDDDGRTDVERLHIYLLPTLLVVALRETVMRETVMR